MHADSHGMARQHDRLARSRIFRDRDEHRVPLVRVSLVRVSLVRVPLGLPGGQFPLPSVGPSASSISFTLFFLSIKKKYFSAEGTRPCHPLETLRLHCRCSALPSAWRSTPRWPELRFNFHFQRWHPLPSAPGRLHLPESSGDIRRTPPRGTNRDLNRARACADSGRHLFHGAPKVGPRCGCPTC